jgi:hypothetical protein
MVGCGFCASTNFGGENVMQTFSQQLINHEDKEWIRNDLTTSHQIQNLLCITIPPYNLGMTTEQDGEKAPETDNNQSINQQSTEPATTEL